jgi:hypothetical protein
MVPKDFKIKSEACFDDLDELEELGELGDLFFVDNSPAPPKSPSAGTPKSSPIHKKRKFN